MESKSQPGPVASAFFLSCSLSKIHINGEQITTMKEYQSGLSVL